MNIPDYWIEFIRKNDLMGKEIEFPWPGEEGLEAVIEIFDEENINLETTEFWPGKGVFGDGYVSIGGCSIGTGDPYFINIHDGMNGPIYKIDHEEVTSSGYIKEKAIILMLSRYEDLLKYLNKPS